jgi:large subunit ribosomal protein L1
LPHPVRSDLRVAVILDPTSEQAEECRKAGAAIVGSVQEVLGDLIKDWEGRQGSQQGKGKKGDKSASAEQTSTPVAGGEAGQQAAGKLKIPFDRLVTTPDQLPLIMKTAAPRILGPKSLLPSVKSGTVTSNIVNFVKDAAGSAEYKEKMGVVRLAIGRLAFSPEQVRDNLEYIVKKMKEDAQHIADNGPVQGVERKEIHEIVLSSTHGPGFSLNGEFRTEGFGPEELKV